MTEHRRESDNWPYRAMKFWPLLAFIGLTVIGYINLKAEVKASAEMVSQIPAIKTDVAVLKSQMDYLVQTVGKIDRRTERTDRR